MTSLPDASTVRRWDGRRADGGVPADGNYQFRIGPLGHRGVVAGGFEFHDHRFPVAGRHAYGDRFGEPRSGGRVHEGQDLPAPCGTPLVAARGGRVQARGYSDALYGYWVLIDGRATRADHFYAHLERADAAERRRPGADRTTRWARSARPATRARSSASFTSSSGRTAIATMPRATRWLSCVPGTRFS